MQKPARAAPRSLRLGPEKCLKLRADAEAFGMSVNAYVIWRVFDPDAPPPKARRRIPKVDHAKVAAALAKLGASRVPHNLNQLAKAANSGSLVLTPDSLAMLREASTMVSDIRQMLLEALGLTEAAT